MFTRLLRLAAVPCLFLALRANAAVLHCVDINSTNPVAPYTPWATAATNIQDAVDAATSGDEVLVTNGVYQYGGRILPGSALTNRLIITNSVAVRSVNGPLVTTIAGYQIPGIFPGFFGDSTGSNAIRCVYMANGASLTGFTITQGATLDGGDDVQDGGDTSGAGILCPLGDPSTVSNCIVVYNIAGDFGGGIYGGTMYNCLVVSNDAQIGSYGGGTFGGSYYNCTITANIANIGAGDAFGNLVNCVVHGNEIGGNYAFDTLNYCCTDIDPGGTGNVIANPLFLNSAAGNYHLRVGSPCVNAGNNVYVATPTDLAGNPRVFGGGVDIGAYELQIHYVDINGTNPVGPFSSWANAATNIQDAVDAASNYDEVLVTNGVYQYGGRVVPPYQLTNRLVVDKPLMVQSVNGPALTSVVGHQIPGIANGNGAIRCAYLTGGAYLVGFTLTGGATRTTGDITNEQQGGGICCFSTGSFLSNCVVTGNTANNNIPTYGVGEAVQSGTLTGCVIASNSAGGVNASVLNNSVVTGNTGGGASLSVLNNCMVVSNSASFSGGGAIQCTLNSCLIAGNVAQNANTQGAVSRSASEEEWPFPFSIIAPSLEIPPTIPVAGPFRAR